MKISGQLRDSDSLLRNPRPNLAPSTCFHCPTYYWSHLHHHHHNFHRFTQYLRIFQWYQCMAIALSSWQISLMKEELRRLFDIDRSQEGVDSQVLQWVLQKSSIPIERGKKEAERPAYCIVHTSQVPTFVSWERLQCKHSCQLVSLEEGWHCNTKHQSKVLPFPPLLTLDYHVLQNS